MERTDYYDLGNDAERWWREHVNVIFTYLHHNPKAKGYDFKGEIDGKCVYIDVKFCRSKYRKEGWLEVKSWGKTTGIFQTAADNYDNDDVGVYIVVLHCGKFYMINAKDILKSFQRGELELLKGIATDDNDVTTDTRYFKINGFNDPRFLVIEGPMRPQLYSPKTSIGKKVDIDEWMQGNWKLHFDTTKFKF